MAQSSDGDSSGAPARVSLAEIFLAFTRISIMSVGGGLTAWVHHELVERRGWLTDQRFLSALAVCQVIPGGNMVNMSVYTGTQLRGLAGAATALFGLVVLPALAIVGLALIYSLLAPFKTTGLALDGVAAAAIGLTFALGWKEARRNAKQLLPLAIMLTTFVSVGLL